MYAALGNLGDGDDFQVHRPNRCVMLNQLQAPTHPVEIR